MTLLIENIKQRLKERKTKDSMIIELYEFLEKEGEMIKVKYEIKGKEYDYTESKNWEFLKKYLVELIKRGAKIKEIKA